MITTGSFTVHLVRKIGQVVCAAKDMPVFARHRRQEISSMRKLGAAFFAAAFAGAALAGARAEMSLTPRLLDELKAEIQARADRNAYPLVGLKPDEVREALARIKSLDRDEWAAAWSEIGDRYMAKAAAAANAAPAEADKDYVAAWLYYSFARWPVPNSAGKEAAYKKALAAYIAHGQLLDPPLEVIRIPFEGKTIVAYMQMPKAETPAPIVFAICGLDSRKEDMAERFRPLLAQGIGYMAIDGPGTGEAPVKAALGAERMLERALELARARPDVDKSRVAVYGGSFGGYWAALLAGSDKDRIKAVVAQSPPVDESFSRAKTMALASNTEYLFDYLPAQMSAYAGATDIDKLAAVKESLSLKTRGLLDRPMPSLLVIGGVHDTQVPLADIDLLLHTGTTPREAWINPVGGHMGRDAKTWPDSAIFKQVTTPWLLRQLAANGD
jgi:dienelactone hydrolase